MRRALAALTAAAGLAFAAHAMAQEQPVVRQTKHEVIQANTLWDLAQYYYKDPWKWPRIHEANTDKIQDPHWIYPGQVFVIPGLDTLVTVIARPAGEEPKVVESPAEPPPEPAEEPVEETAPAVEQLSESLPKDVPITASRRISSRIMASSSCRCPGTRVLQLWCEAATGPSYHSRACHSPSSVRCVTSSTIPAFR